MKVINYFSSDHFNLNKLFKEYDVLPREMFRYIDKDSALKYMKEHRHEFYDRLEAINQINKLFPHRIDTIPRVEYNIINCTGLAAILHVSDLDNVNPGLCREHFRYYKDTGRWHSHQCLT